MAAEIDIEDVPFGPPDAEPAPRKRNRIHEQFSPRPVAMQRSEPYRVLHNSERMMLDRVEIEFASHAGKDNGKLPVTFEQFEEYGIRRAMIAPSRRALVALGFLTFSPGIAAEGFAKRRPSMFGLTYRHTADAEPAHNWRKVTDLAEAVRVANVARDTLDEGAKRPRRKGPPVLRLVHNRVA
jgi:hypothetical protein